LGVAVFVFAGFVNVPSRLRGGSTGCVVRAAFSFAAFSRAA
jgi:hypothetical protein